MAVKDRSRRVLEPPTTLLHLSLWSSLEPMATKQLGVPALQRRTGPLGESFGVILVCLHTVVVRLSNPSILV